MKKNYLLIIAIISILNFSCAKYVDTPLPADQLVSELVFTDDKTATAAVTGVYANMNAFNYQFANVLISYLSAMQADDLYYASAFANYDVFRNNTLLPSSQYVNANWSSLYSYIYQANSCIAGLTAATGLTPSVRDHLLGEAYFQRAFFYFYLVNMYGDVPLIINTNYAENNLKQRDPQQEVYSRIISDLTEAKNLMSDAYPSTTKFRPNKAVATALLARVYLYNRQWDLSETEASRVINDSRYSLLSDLNAVFLGNSGEAIWQLQSINFGGGRNTWEGNVTVPSTPTANSLFRLDTITLIPSFESNDLRLANWTGYRKSATTGASHYFPFKYKVRFDAANPVKEHTMVMRFAEQYLIRAEARIQQNKLDEGKADLDSIRVRAGIGALPSGMSKDALLLEVEKQRRLELFAEWGHRWFDLKRTQRADEVLKTRPEKAGWQITDTLYPIPLDARSTNPNLTQNAGYQ